MQVGDYVDAQDTEHKWYDSRIEAVFPAFSDDRALPRELRGTPDDKLKVHFMGWDARFDFFFVRSSLKLQPLFSKVPFWRDFRVNDKIELKAGGKWYSVNVEEVDRTLFRVRLKSSTPAYKDKIGDVWKDFMRCGGCCHGGASLFSVDPLLGLSG